MIVGHQSRHGRAAPSPGAVRVAAPAPGTAPQTIIPFDYAATFALTGTVGNLIQAVINFDLDSVFVATGIGYGLEEHRGESLALINGPLDPSFPGALTLNNLPPQALVQGFRAHSRFLNTIFDIAPGGGGEIVMKALKLSTTNAMPLAILNKSFQLARNASELSFMFSMVDTDSGRELQDEPTNNLASLGISNGERPFRMLARPMFFSPRSTLRMQIEELSQDVKGTLFIVLYGYKVLSMGCPEPVARSIHGPAFCRTETIGNPSDRIIPFDYVTKFTLTGQTGNVVEDEIAINVEGGFVATAVGYGLAAGEEKVKITDALNSAGIAADPFNLQTLPLSIFPADALMGGIRVHSKYLRFVFDSTGNLNTIPLALMDEVFMRLNRPENVSFRYSILDSGTGRELQNQPIYSVAGLGIANGKRPFKQLARPMIFLPRSTLRVTVEERSGQGELYIVFQGYKILGANSAHGGS
jgi:hypothetical protein